MDADIKEACGLFGVYGAEDAVELTFRGLFSLQHRGQESAGIASSDRQKLKSYRGLGLVSEVFDGANLDELRNPVAIGHVRYSTTGSSTLLNAQPILVDYWRGQAAVAHNGNLVNAPSLRREFELRGSIFQTTSDSETIVHLIARPDFSENRDAIMDAVRKIRGSFCLLVLTPREMVAIRDPLGFRPLCLGKIDDAYVVASETCALDLVGATTIREIEPGEALFIDDWGLDSRRICDSDGGPYAHCIFESIYFARPDSIIFGDTVQEFRKRLGRQLAKEYPVEADVVFPVPDSGNAAALGFALESGTPQDDGFIRNHYVGRTFIDPDVKGRGRKVSMKLNTVAEAIRGKRVVVVDDSIVRGVTTIEKIRQIRDCGPKEIHMRVSCPPIRHPCYFGIDFPTRKELIANDRDVEQIRAKLGLTTLGYLSIDGMLSCVRNGPENNCAACFSGEYPVEVEGERSKEILENRGCSD